MKEEKLFETLGKIDEQYIEEARIAGKNNRKVWTRYVAIAACLCIVAGGVFGITKVSRKLALKDKPVIQSPVNTAGVYIPPTELPKNTAGVEFDMIALVVYKGGIYTQAESYYDTDAENIEVLVGDYLGYATGSINEWSTQDEYATEFASSCRGEVHSVKGYDTNFRVCIRNEYQNENGEKSLWIQFMDRLNDINLEKGSDLFETRLHFSDNVAEIKYQSHDDWNNAAGNIKTAEIDPLLWQEFINEIDNAVWQYKWNPKEKATVYDTENQAHISLVMKDGTVNEIRMLEGRYVSYDPMIWYFVQISEDTFNSVFASCGGTIK